MLMGTCTTPGLGAMTGVKLWVYILFSNVYLGIQNLVYGNNIYTHWVPFMERWAQRAQMQRSRPIKHPSPAVQKQDWGSKMWVQIC